MKRYQITVGSGKVQIDNPKGESVLLNSGDIVREDQIGRGCLESLLRLKRAVEVPPEPVQAPAAPPAVAGPAKAPEVQTKRK